MQIVITVFGTCKYSLNQPSKCRLQLLLPQTKTLFMGPSLELWGRRLLSSSAVCIFWFTIVQMAVLIIIDFPLWVTGVQNPLFKCQECLWKTSLLYEIRPKLVILRALIIVVAAPCAIRYPYINI